METPEQKRRRVMEAMAASLKPVESPVQSTEGLEPNLRPDQPIPFPNVPTDEQMAETSQQTRPYRVGYGAKGLTGVDRDMLKQKVMQEAPARSEIEDRGDTIGYGTVQKGEPWWKRLGKGVLTGLANGDPDNPNNILGSAIGGGATSASSNQNAALLKRTFDLRKGKSDIARGLKLEQEAAQLDNMQGAKMGQMSTRVVNEGEYPGIEAGTEIRVRMRPNGEVEDIVGPNKKPVVSQSIKKDERAPHYEKDAEGYLIQVKDGTASRVPGQDGQPVRVTKQDKDGEVVEVEVNGRVLKVTPGQALSYYGQIGERENKRSDDQNAVSFTNAQTEQNIKAAETERDSIWASLKDIPQTVTRPHDKYAGETVSEPNPAYNDLMRRGRELDDQIRTYRGQLKAPKSQSGSSSRQGRTMSQANLARYAKDKGLTIEQAKASDELKGVTIR